MYKFAIIFFLLLISLGAVSQMPVLNWAITFDEDNIGNYRVGNNGRTVAVDGQGNVFSAGLFQYAVDFDPGPGVYSLTGGGAGSYGIYISNLILMQILFGLYSYPLM